MTDTQAISLDEWSDPAEIPPLDADTVAIGRQMLPAVWTVSDEDGRLLVYPNDMGGYMYRSQFLDVTYRPISPAQHRCSIIVHATRQALLRRHTFTGIFAVVEPTRAVR